MSENEKKSGAVKSRISGLLTRIASGGVYVGISVIAVLVNDVTNVIMLSAVAAICAFEFYRLLRHDAKMPNELMGIIAAAAFPVACWKFGLHGIIAILVLFTVALSIWYVFYLRARIVDVAVSYFGAIYTGLLLCGLIYIRAALPEPYGGILLLLLFISIWGNDALAYLVGSRIGRHKLAPKVSPKKSWEGFIAGLLFSAAMWVAMCFVPGVTMSWWLAAAFGIVAGLISVLGDLLESRVKRNVGVKDSGNLMPGHGGLLDRCDSLFMVSMMAALMLFGGGCIPYAGL
ncbi:MAG: phosphatidate cytidylyltransferase [Eggerthellaceae bacterium]